jgi:hypothetical protein
MTKNKFDEGDIVLVESLKNTKPQYGTNSSMEGMVGECYEVKSVGHDLVSLQSDQGSNWSFSPRDLKLADDIFSGSMPNELIMFDPNELI